MSLTIVMLHIFALPVLANLTVSFRAILAYQVIGLVSDLPCRRRFLPAFHHFFSRRRQYALPNLSLSRSVTWSGIEIWCRVCPD